MTYGISAGQPVVNVRSCARSESSSSVVRLPTLVWAHSASTQSELAVVTKSTEPCVSTMAISLGDPRASLARLVSSMLSTTPVITSWCAPRHSPRARLYRSMPLRLDSGMRLITPCPWLERRTLSS